LRLFAAVYPPAPAVEHLVSFVSGLRVGLAAAEGVNTRLARADTLHVTMAFLGDVADDRLTAVTAALARAVDGPAPSVCLTGGGRFGRGAFTVLWTGLGGDVDALRGLAGTLRRSLKKARLPHDDRPWKPHLTIARPGDRLDRAAIDADRAALAAYRGPVWPAAEVVLMRSHLGPRPTYDRLAAWPLQP